MKLRYLLIHVAYGDRRVDAEDFTPMISFLIVLTPERPQKGGPVNDDNYDQGLRKKKERRRNSFYNLYKCFVLPMEGQFYCNLWLSSLRYNSASES